MIKGSEIRRPEYPVDKIFLDRWSPRAMSGGEISDADLRVLFEAARWAPSSYNAQPWRILYARRGTPQWPLFFDLMIEFNQTWAKNAAALVLLVSREKFEHNEKPAPTHSFDCGAAWMSLALQGAMKGYVVHGMQGFDYEKAKTVLGIPDGFRVEAMAAIGLPASKETLPQEMREREVPSSRRPMAEIVCEGKFAW